MAFLEHGISGLVGLAGLPPDEAENDICYKDVIPTKRVILFPMGGTISSRVDPESGAAVPMVGGTALRDLLPSTGEVAVDVRDIAQLGGSQVTPELAFDVAEQVQRALTEEGYSGAVITQGTDSVEETAYLLDLVVDVERPVVHTASMRNHSDLGFEGLRNLHAAVQVASCDAARGQGVLVVMNDYIFAAGEVMKTDTVNPAAFASPGRGPLGVVMRDHPVFYHRTLTRQHLVAMRLETRVPVIRLCLGMGGEFIEAAVSAGAQGIVLEGNGAGNIPERAVPAILSTLARGVPVVVTSSAFQGIVDDIYGYPGGGHALRRAGVIFGQGLTAAKARIKLMLALGAEYQQDDLRRVFEYLF